MNYALAYEHRLDAARRMIRQAVLEGRGCGHACHEYYQSRRRDDVPSHLPERVGGDVTRWEQVATGVVWCGDGLSQPRESLA